MGVILGYNGYTGNSICGLYGSYGSIDYLLLEFLGDLEYLPGVQRNTIMTSNPPRFGLQRREMASEDKRVNVLDRGYVRLVDHMGSDISVVNAARVSYDKESLVLTERDVKLIHYLAKHGHTSPFRHATLEFEVYAPLMVARQWFKYRVGSHHYSGDDEGFDDPLYARNESSRRYVTEDPAFYSDVQWREAPEHSKQGSGMPIQPTQATYWTETLANYQKLGTELYNQAMTDGICPEQARLFLPAYGMYIRWRWTCSLLAVVHFLQQRLGHDAQSEIREYAEGVMELVKGRFPVSIEALMG